MKIYLYDDEAEWPFARPRFQDIRTEIHIDSPMDLIREVAAAYWRVSPTLISFRNESYRTATTVPYEPYGREFVFHLKVHQRYEESQGSFAGCYTWDVEGAKLKPLDPWTCRNCFEPFETDTCLELPCGHTHCAACADVISSPKEDGRAATYTCGYCLRPTLAHNSNIRTAIDRLTEANQWNNVNSHLNLFNNFVTAAEPSSAKCCHPVLARSSTCLKRLHEALPCQHEVADSDGAASTDTPRCSNRATSRCGCDALLCDRHMAQHVAFASPPHVQLPMEYDFCPDPWHGSPTKQPFRVAA